MSKILINKILIKDRLRLDKGDIDRMAESFKTIGQIHPILLRVLSDPIDGKTHQLVAGERRLLAAVQLGWTEIAFTEREQLSDRELHIIELEENIRRKSMSWQERALAIAKVHRMQLSDKMAVGDHWSMQSTGELLDMTAANVCISLTMAKELVNEKSECWQADSFSDGWRILSSRLLGVAEKTLAAKAGAVPLLTQAAPAPTLIEEAEARVRYYNNPLNPPDSFESYWQEKNKPQRQVIPISQWLLNASCLDFMRDRGPAFCDHIVTDPPYAIDMDMLEQENVGMANIDSVAKEHNVDENMDLLLEFIPLAFNSIRDKGFLVMWCDAVLFEWLRTECRYAGFVVQRWPFIWVKSDFFSNKAASYNMTKCTEYALIARKPTAQLTRNSIPNYILCPFADEMSKQFEHPFAKPFQPWKALVDAVSLPGQLIYDPFMGEGSGILSMLRLNRKVLGTELVATHHYKALQQVKKYYETTQPGAEIQ